MKKFESKIALIGGNLGKIKHNEFILGLGGLIAQRLQEEGAQVVIVDIDYNIALKCGEFIGGRVKPFQCNLMEDLSFNTEDYIDHRGKKKKKIIWKNHPALSMIEEIAKEFGKIDILITNFDFYQRARVQSYTEEQYIELREKNITPTFHLLSGIRNQLSKQKKELDIYGKVVMLTSIVGRSGIAAASLYAAFKGSIISLTKSLSREFSRFANVNTVACGPFAEKKMQGPKEKIKNSFLTTQTEMAKQSITFKKVIPLIFLLCSDEGIAINGQNINLDGGLWLKLQQ